LTVPDISECRFYHTLELPTHGRQEGVWDLVGRFGDYTGHIPLNGKTVLDVGTASGFLTFEAESRGATVTSLDLDDPAGDHTNHTTIPIIGSEYVTDPVGWRAKGDEQLRGWRNAYRLAHADFGSQARCVYRDVYDIGTDLGVFDVVLVGQLLVHLPDAINALAAAASVCQETIVVTEGNFPVDEPLAALCARANLPDIPYAWYHYSHGWYREVLAMLGFPDVTITVGSYACGQADHADMVELATVVGRR
jgi:SAM-dependent methyltransferase